MGGCERLASFCFSSDAVVCLPYHAVLALVAHARHARKDPVMHFRPATPEDFDAVVAITTAGREFLASQGLDQWQGGNPSPERVREDIERGYDYLAVDEQTGEPLGVVAFCGEAEPDYANVTSGAWLTEAPNDPGQPSPYAVLHRMAVATAGRRGGVASFLLQECLDLARERGFTSVRVDTHHGNLPMQGCFSKNGFTRCCDILITSPIEPTKERVGFEIVL